MTTVKDRCSGCDGNEQDKRYDELDKVIAEYKGKPGTLIPVLHAAQKILENFELCEACRRNKEMNKFADKFLEAK